jgi:hypothetical protein
MQIRITEAYSTYIDHCIPKLKTGKRRKKTKTPLVMTPKLSSSFPVVMKSWHEMLKAIMEQGYSLSEIARISGINRRSLQRWFNGEETLPDYTVFTRILYLYCHLQYNANAHEES